MHAYDYTTYRIAFSSVPFTTLQQCRAQREAYGVHCTLYSHITDNRLLHWAPIYSKPKTRPVSSDWSVTQLTSVASSSQPASQLWGMSGEAKLQRSPKHHFDGGFLVLKNFLYAASFNSTWKMTWLPIFSLSRCRNSGIICWRTGKLLT